mmetsp:Transcript_23875/g.21215  ORF Transcript_23875/g.21215 Transcript_23875/m.21215 type:complete len:95 (-) Transcript_23875:16-300(-)
MDDCIPVSPNLLEILKTQKIKLKTVARMCTEAIEADRVKMDLLTKLISQKMYSYQLGLKIEEKEVKKKMVEDIEKNEMYKEILFGKILTKELIQ